MALKLNERYPGRFDSPSAGYPQGSFKNRTAPGALDGSYLEKDWANDKEGFFQSLLDEAAIAPDGLVDQVGSSQYYDALLQVISNNAATDFLNTTRINVASASTVNLTTAAPNTRHINITGTTTINGFTVAAGQCYFVRFDGVLTLTNNAAIVTQSGANISTRAGDTCIIRATAANVVEVMVYVDATVQSLTANGYRRFKDGLIIQWTTVTGNGTFSWPIAFPTSVLAVSLRDISGFSFLNVGPVTFNTAGFTNTSVNNAGTAQTGVTKTAIAFGF